MSKPQDKAAITRMENAMLFFGDRKYGSPYLMEQYLKKKSSLEEKLKEVKQHNTGTQGSLNFS